MIKVTNELALEAIRTVKVQDQQVRITMGDIGQEAYAEVKRVFTAMGGKWNRSIEGFTFDREFKSHLARLQETGVFDKKKANDFFATSPKLAEELVSGLDLFVEKENSFLYYMLTTHDRPLRILEPSAGHGALVQAFVSKLAEELPDLRCEVDCVELDPINAQTLRSKGLNVVHEGDFLQYQTDKRYDIVLMNPPFSLAGHKDCYIDHVEHALSMLDTADYCELAAIIPDNVTQGDPTPKKARFLNRLWQNTATLDSDNGFGDSRSFANVGANVKTKGLYINSNDPLQKQYDYMGHTNQYKVDLFSVHLRSGPLSDLHNRAQTQIARAFKEGRLPDAIAEQIDFNSRALHIFKECFNKQIFVDYYNLRPYVARLAEDLGYSEAFINASWAYGKGSEQTNLEKELKSWFFKDYVEPANIQTQLAEKIEDMGSRIKQFSEDLGQTIQSNLQLDLWGEQPHGI